MAFPLLKEWRDERQFKKDWLRMYELSKLDAGWKNIPLEQLGEFTGKPTQNLRAILGKLPRDYEDSARAYLNHDGIAGPMDALALNAASVPIRYYDARSVERGPSEWKESKSPLAQALKRINPLSFASPFNHYSDTYYHAALSGDAYWRFDPAGYVYTLRPDRVDIKVNGQGLESGFAHTVNNETTIYPADTVLHFRKFHPLSDHYGASQVLSLALSIENDFFMLSYQRDFFKNSAVPRILIMAKYHMGEAARKRFVEHWKQKYSGVGKMFGVSLLEGGDFKVEDLAKSARDAEFTEGRKTNRAAFQARFGTPPGIMSEPVANYATMREQKEVFWLGTVWLTITQVLGQFNAWDQSEKQGVIAMPDIWAHPQLRQIFLAKMQDAVPLVNAGVLLVNEIREQYSLGPVPWGDVWNQPGNLYGGGTTENNNSEGDEEKDPSPSEEPGDKSSHASLLKNYQSKNSDAPPAPSLKDERYEFRRAKWKSFDEQAQGHAEKWFKLFQPAYEKQKDKAVKAIASANIPTGKALHDAAMNRADGGHYEKLFSLISHKDKDDEYGAWLDGLLGEMLDEDTENEILEDIAHGEYEEMIDEYGNEGMIEAGDTGGTFDASDENALDFIKEKEVKFASEVNGTTREKLRSMLIEKVDAGANIQEITDGVKDVFSQLDSLDPDRARRARTIARTEVQSAANKGQLEGYYQAGAERKEWTTAGDGDVRDIHEAIDGEVVPLRSPFSNGLMYPGDVNGDAEEVVNCRCSIAPVI